MTTLSVHQLEWIAYSAGVLCFVLICALIALLGYVLRGLPPTLQERIDTEDTNGCDLIRMARQLDACALDVRTGGDRISHDELRAWAAICRRVASEHLDTLNALSLEALTAVADSPVHLGRFPGSNGPAPRGAKPAPPPTPPAAREAHHATT